MHRNPKLFWEIIEKPFIVISSKKMNRNSFIPEFQQLGLESNESLWNYTFPERHQDYSYTRFLRAVAKFKAFCGTYSDGRDSDAICRKSLATMFAHFVLGML